MKKFMKFVSAVAAVSLVAAPLAVSADEKTFLLGGSGPLTGAAASYGTSVKSGSGDRHSGDQRCRWSTGWRGYL